MFRNQQFPAGDDALNENSRRSLTESSPRMVKAARPWGSVAIIALMLGGGLLLESADGKRVQLRGLPAAVLPEVCWSKRWLGWPCPLCGATRSVILLVQGRWRESWAMQPAGSLVLLTAVVCAAISWGAFLRGATNSRFVLQLTQSLWIGLFLFLVIRHLAITIGWTESAANPSRTHASAPSVR